MNMNKMKSTVVGVLFAAMMVTSLPVHAGIIGTERMVAQEARVASLNTVQNYMAGEEVAAQLRAWGVSPEAVDARIAALSDAELQQLATTIQTDPAGAGVLEAVGVVFVVILVLELLGITNFFRRV
jgi:hypothetical protein